MKSFIITNLVIYALALCLFAQIIRESWNLTARRRGAWALAGFCIGLMSWAFWLVAS
jgi:hypothetical protein